MTTETMGNNCPLALFTEALATVKRLSAEKYSLGQVVKSHNLTQAANVLRWKVHSPFLYIKEEHRFLSGEGLMHIMLVSTCVLTI